MTREKAIYWTKPCKKCGKIIDSRKDSFSITPYRGLYCIICTDADFLYNLKKIHFRPFKITDEQRHYHRVWTDKMREENKKDNHQKFHEAYMLKSIDDIYCPKCNLRIPLKDLVFDQEIELNHPKNKGKHKDSDNLFVSEFKRCPFCKKILISN